MTPSVACLDLIRNSEGLQLKAYRCPAGIWTIGWGHTGADVYEGLQINLGEAEALLEKDAAWAADSVTKLAGDCTQGQFDALTDFVFNLGLARLQGSTLLHKHRAGNFVGAAAEFGKWVHADGQVLAGLVKRRAAETAMYLSDEP